MGEKFLDTWADRTLGELFTVILTTMPSDGVHGADADQTLDVIGPSLKANGIPEGPRRSRTTTQ